MSDEYRLLKSRRESGSTLDVSSLCVLFTDGADYQRVLGSIDYAFLFAYAIGMFIRYC